MKKKFKITNKNGTYQLFQKNIFWWVYKCQCLSRSEAIDCINNYSTPGETINVKITEKKNK